MAIVPLHPWNPSSHIHPQKTPVLKAVEFYCNGMNCTSPLVVASLKEACVPIFLWFLLNKYVKQAAAKERDFNCYLYLTSKMYSRILRTLLQPDFRKFPHWYSRVQIRRVLRFTDTVKMARLLAQALELALVFLTPAKDTHTIVFPVCNRPRHIRWLH